jgi:hypothetical protein
MLHGMLHYGKTRPAAPRSTLTNNMKLGADVCKIPQGVKTEGALEIYCISARAPPCAWDFICHTQIIDLHTGPTQHVRVLISAELDHATLYAQG